MKKSYVQFASILSGILRVFAGKYIFSGPAIFRKIFDPLQIFTYLTCSSSVSEDSDADPDPDSDPETKDTWWLESTSWTTKYAQERTYDY